MKVLVVGGEGSTGKRYCKILDNMGIEVISYDIKIHAEKPFPKCDKAIIATPTHLHYKHYNKVLMDTSIIRPCNILVEKPAAPNRLYVRNMFCKIVCNWAFVFPDTILQPGKCRVYYEHHYTGKEGFWFDTCQLHILSDGKGQIISDTFSFQSEINGCMVTLGMIEVSYKRMIKAWLETPELIWNVQDLIPEHAYIIKKHWLANE